MRAKQLVTVLGIVLLAVTTALVSYRIGRGRSPEQAEPVKNRRPVHEPERRDEPAWIQVYNAAASDAIEVRSGRDRQRLLNVLASGSSAPGETDLLLAELQPEEIRDALAVLERQPEPARSHSIRALLARWAEFAPQDAVAYTLANYQGTGLVGPAQEIVGAWAKHDPEAALKWYDDNTQSGVLPPAVRDSRAIARITYAWGQSDPKRAVEICIAEKWQTAWRGFGGLAASDQHRPAALAAVLAVEDEEERLKGISSLARAWSDVDPQAATIWLDQQQLHGHQVQKFVAEKFARQNPGGYADWILARATGDESRSRAAARAASEWADTDATAAGAWLEANSLIDERSIAAMIDHYARSDIDKAIEWAQRAGDGGARDQLLIDAIVAALNHGKIKKSDLRKYTGHGSSPAEEIEQKIKDLLEEYESGL